MLSKVGEDTYEKCPEKYTQHCWLVECRGAVSKTFCIFFLYLYLLYFCPELWTRHLCQQELRDVPRWERRCSTCASSWAPPSTCTWPRWRGTHLVMLSHCNFPTLCDQTEERTTLAFIILTEDDLHAANRMFYRLKLTFSAA